MNEAAQELSRTPEITALVLGIYRDWRKLGRDVTEASETTERLWANLVAEDLIVWQNVPPLRYQAAWLAARELVLQGRKFEKRRAERVVARMLARTGAQ